VTVTTRTVRGSSTRAWLIGVAVAMSLGALGILGAFGWSKFAPHGRLDGVHSYAVYYGNNLEYTAHLGDYDLGIVQPNTLSLPALKKLTSSGKRLVAYITIGESDGPSIGLPKEWILGKNENWGSTLVDANQVGWQDRVLERASDIMSFGFSGFFLDTLDTVDLFPKTKPGMIRIVERLRERFPNAVIVQNRGFRVLPETSQLIDAVMFEDYSTSYDFQSQQYLSSDGDAESILRVQTAQRAGVKVLALDYADDPGLRRRAIDRAKAAGFIPFVTNISLNTLESRAAQEATP
jgi:uncharacterized protein (TIGR01370 family)